MSEWKVSPVHELFFLGRGRVISGEELTAHPGEFPVYSSQTSNEGEFGRIDTYDFEGEMITWTTDGANAGTVYYRSGKFNCTNVCGTLRAKDAEKVDHRYFSLLLSTHAKNHVSYIGNPKLMNGEMSKIRLNFPPLPEQRLIAKILDTLDTAIRRTEDIIAKLQKVKDGLLHDLLTRGVDESGQLRPRSEDAPHLYKDSPLGKIPKEWEVRDVRWLGEVVTGFTPPTENSVLWGDGIDFVTPAEISDSGELSESKRKVTKLGLKYVRLLPPGSVLCVCIGSTIGKVAFSENPLCTNQQINALIPSAGIDKQYAFQVLRKFSSNLEKVAGLQAVPIVNKTTFSSLLVVIAEGCEQTKIGLEVKTASLAINTEARILDKLRLQKQGLMNDLLTGKVRVTELLKQEAV